MNPEDYFQLTEKEIQDIALGYPPMIAEGFIKVGKVRKDGIGVLITGSGEEQRIGTIKNPIIAKLLKREKDNKIKNENAFGVFSRRWQIEEFWKQQPFFYDEAKIFWLWNKEEFKWKINDEINFLNLIQETLGIETIDSKTRTELIAGFQQIGRKHKPLSFGEKWIQFKNQIYDIETQENFESSPEFFTTNPIPYKIGESEETPTIDKLFIEWVGEEHKQELYENIAYNISRNKFMQRIFALCGGGSNGKGTYIKLNYKFLGKENCVSSEIKNLSEDKFEPAVLYKKLLCVMGEVSYDDLKNTNMLKKLGGEDMISFQFKGKTPFSDENTASCVCLTNSLPNTPDKSLGFYRKWHIIDFPNQFNGIEQDIISKIPETEFENLALKCLKILKNLYNSKKFTNEGSFQERMEKYEQHSNPIQKFIEFHCIEEVGQTTSLRDFSNSLNNYLKENHFRILSAHQVGKILRNEGFLVGNRKINDISSVVILNLKLLKPLKLLQVQLETHRETDRDINSFDGFNVFKDKINVKDSINEEKKGSWDSFSDEEIKEMGYESREKLEKMTKGSSFVQPNN